MVQWCGNMMKRKQELNAVSYYSQSFKPIKLELF